MDFSKRSSKRELLDRPGIPFAAIEQNMKELEFINRHLGGHAISCHAVASLAKERKELHICEVGCGGGDNLIAIERWAKRGNRKFRYTGIDINPECISYANEHCRSLKAVNFICSDYKRCDLKSDRPDIIFSSLFCHHLDANELRVLANWKRTNSTVGYFVNDLQRNGVAYYSIKLLTTLFSRSYLVKHDAPLSVLRGFSKKELVTAFDLPDGGAVKWRWAFRWLLIQDHER